MSVATERAPRARWPWAIIALALLTFVPSLYLYTTSGGRFSRLTNLLCLGWGVLLVLILAGAFEDPKPFMWASFTFPIYYFVVSWAITLDRWFGAKDLQFVVVISPVAPFREHVAPVVGLAWKVVSMRVGEERCRKRDLSQVRRAGGASRRFSRHHDRGQQ